MATRAITLLLLSFAFCFRAYATPVPPCGGIAPSPAALSPEVYNQNNGQPLVLFAYGDSANEVAPSAFPPPALAPVLPAPAPCAPALPLPPAPPALPLPPPAHPAPAPYAPTGDAADLDAAQKYADQSIADAPVETIPAPDKPCKVETSTEIVQTPGETFVHQPGEILINQPPTRLIINHAPYIVRPSPIVLNSGGKTITNSYTRKILPSSIQLRPVIVRIVRPIEKKVLIDKPQVPGGKTYASTPVIPDACSASLALAEVPGAAASAGLAIADLPAASPDYGLSADASSDYSYGATAPAALDYQSLLASPGAIALTAAGNEAEIQTDSGSVLTALPAPSGSGCGCV